MENNIYNLNDIVATANHRLNIKVRSCNTAIEIAAEAVPLTIVNAS